MEFMHIGYNIRRWPTDSYLTTDATEWEIDDDLFEQAKLLPGVSENVFQLLEAPSNESVENLARLVDLGDTAALVGFEALMVVVNAYSRKIKIPIKESVWGKFNWELLGYDVCDVNGLFSALHMEIGEIPYRDLFKEEQLSEALTVIQLGSILSPEHTPFVLMKLSRLSNVYQA